MNLRFIMRSARINGSALAGALTIGTSLSAAPAESELELIADVEPQFPEQCAESRLESHQVIVGYDISVEGKTENLSVVESSDECFEQSAIDAVSKFRYKPRTVQGAPVPVTGLRTRITYTTAAMRDEVESELDAVRERVYDGDGAGALQLLSGFEARHGRKLTRYEYATFLWMRGVAHSLVKDYAAARTDLKAALDTNNLYPETSEWIRSLLAKVEAKAGD